MPVLFKVEIFDRSLTFKAFSPIAQPSISYDYLTLEPTEITCRGIYAEKGDFAVISSPSGSAYQGIVDDVQLESGATRLSIRPLLSLFDLDVHFDRTQSHQLESFLAGIITANFGSNADALQNIAGLTVTTTSTTVGYLNLKDNVHNLYEIIVKCLTAYGIVVSVTLAPQTQTAQVVIGKATTSATIEADLKGVLDKSFTLGDSYGAPNKLVCVNSADETQVLTYYLHTDGAIDTDGSANRITPVFASAELVDVDDGDTFAAASYAAAYDALKPDEYNDLIEITAPNDSRIIDVTMPIGTAATIYHDGAAYSTILTGYTRRDEITTLIFGCVRIDLTKKLILERRRQK